MSSKIKMVKTNINIIHFFFYKKAYVYIHTARLKISSIFLKLCLVNQHRMMTLIGMPFSSIFIFVKVTDKDAQIVSGFVQTQVLFAHNIIYP